MIEVLMRFSGNFVANAPTLYSDSRCLKAVVARTTGRWLQCCSLGDIRVCVKGVKVKVADKVRRGLVSFRARACIKIWTEKGSDRAAAAGVFLLSFVQSCLDRERCSLDFYDSGQKEGEIHLDRSWLHCLRCRRAEENRRTAE